MVFHSFCHLHLQHTLLYFDFPAVLRSWSREPKLIAPWSRIRNYELRLRLLSIYQRLEEIL
jgi:hypothetical protein